MRIMGILTPSKCTCTGLGVMPPVSSFTTLPTFSLEGPAPTPASTLLTTTAAAHALCSLVPTPSRVPIASHSWPLPTKKIIDREFIDMGQLLPDSWHVEEEEAMWCCHQLKRRHRGLVTDILLWVECYSTMDEVLATHYPSKTPKLMAY